jgi:type I restriction enzyme S subunit
MNDQLPKDWKVVRLGDYAKTEKGKKPKAISNEKTKEFSVPYINIKAFEKNIIDEYTDGVGCVLCEDDDFLMVWDGSRSGYVGKAIKGALGSTLVKIKLPEVDHDFAYYFLQSKFIEINSRAKGVGIPHVDPNIVWNYKFPLPPPTAQQQIVSKIEELFSEVDKGIDELKTAQQQLKVYRQSVLKWVFEGRLTNKNVQEGELPKSWSFEPLGSLMESVRNGSSKKPDDTNEFKILRISSVRPNKVDVSEVRTLLSEIGDDNSVMENDLLFTRYNGSIEFVGVCGRVPKLLSKLFYPDKLIRCRPLLKETFHSAYLEYAANYGNARKFVLSKIKTTAGQTGISGTDVKQIPIPLAPLAEQQQIVQEIESRLSVCDKIEETITNSLKQAEALRQSILKKAFEGKLI